MALKFIRPGGNKYYAESTCGKFRVAIFKTQDGKGTQYLSFKKVKGAFQRIGRAFEINEAKKLCEESVNG